MRQLSQDNQLSHREFGNFQNGESDKRTPIAVEHGAAKTVYEIREIQTDQKCAEHMLLLVDEGNRSVFFFAKKMKFMRTLI